MNFPIEICLILISLSCLVFVYYAFSCLVIEKEKKEQKLKELKTLNAILEENNEIRRENIKSMKEIVDILQKTYDLNAKIHEEEETRRSVNH